MIQMTLLVRISPVEVFEAVHNIVVCLHHIRYLSRNVDGNIDCSPGEGCAESKIGRQGT